MRSPSCPGRSSGGPTAPLLSRPIQVEDFMRNRVWVWGLPIARMTRTQAVEAVVELVEVGQPSFFITANTHYAMVTHEDRGLQAVNAQAAFVLADGAPLVWASRMERSSASRAGRGLGPDLRPVPAAARDGLPHLPARRGGGGGRRGRPKRWAQGTFPGLCIVGHGVPSFRDSPRPKSTAELTRSDPRGETRDPVRRVWPAQGRIVDPPAGRFLQSLGVPVCVQVGAWRARLRCRPGRVCATGPPLWLQRLGLEWAYRMWRAEPTRLAPRHARNAHRFLWVGSPATCSAASDYVSRSSRRAPDSSRAQAYITNPGPEGDHDSKGALTSLIES